MPTRSIEQVLAPYSLLGLVEQVRAPGTVMQDVVGMGIGGPNTEQHPGRQFSFDIFDSTRKLAAGRSPASPSKRIAPQKVASVLGEHPRQSESILLIREKYENLRQIGGPINQLDPSGEAYIAKQVEYLSQRFRNVREFQVAAMFRGSYTYSSQADGSLIHDFSGGGQTINYQLPAGNKSQLDLNGGGDVITAVWSTAGTDIPLQLGNLNAEMLQLTGRGLRTIMLPWAVWNDVINNTAVINQAGSANAPLVQAERTTDGGSEIIRAKLAGQPLWDWIIVDNGLEVGTSDTYTKMIGSNEAVFLPEWDRQIGTYLEGGETITEETNRVTAHRMGFYLWAEEHGNPAGHEIVAVQNGIPAAYNPNAWCYGTVNGF